MSTATHAASIAHLPHRSQQSVPPMDLGDEGSSPWGGKLEHAVAPAALHRADMASRCALAVEPCSAGFHSSTRRPAEHRRSRRRLVYHPERCFRAHRCRCTALPRSPWPKTTPVWHPVDQARGRRRPSGASGSPHAAHRPRSRPSSAASEGACSVAKLSPGARCPGSIAARPHGLSRPR